MSNNFDAVKFLAESSPDINAADVNGKTPLINAARYGHEEIIKFLIYKGADLKAVDNEGNSAAALAELNGYPDAAGFIKANMTAKSI